MLLCLLQGCIALEFGFVSLGLHCFLRLSHALYCRSRQCLAYVAFSVYHTTVKVPICTNADLSRESLVIDCPT